MPVLTNSNEAPIKEDAINSEIEDKFIVTKKSPHKMIIFWLLLFTIITGLGIYWWQIIVQHEETDDAYVEAHITSISPKVGGVITNVFVEENERVKKGQLLAKIDPTDYQIKVEQLQAEVNLSSGKAAQAIIALKQSVTSASAEDTKSHGDTVFARAGIQAAKSNIAQCQAAVHKQEAEVESLTAKLHQAKSDYDRTQKLDKEQAVSKQELEQEQTKYTVALAELHSAEQALKELQYKVIQATTNLTQSYGQWNKSEGIAKAAIASEEQTAVKEKEIEIAKDSLQQAQANLKEALQNFSYTTIVSPVSGRIGHRNLEIGQRVDIGQPILAIVEDTPWISANFKETQISHIRPGQNTEIHIDSLPGSTLKGKVDSLAPASGAMYALLPPENATGNFTKVVQRIPVKIVFNQESLNLYRNRLSPGMSAVVSIFVK